MPNRVSDRPLTSKNARSHYPAGRIATGLMTGW